MTSVNDHLLRPLLPFYAAGPFLLNTPLFYSSAKNKKLKKKSDKNIYNEREKKLNCGETVFFFFFFPFLSVGISFLWKSFSSFCMFFLFFCWTYVSDDEQQTNKQRK